VAVLPATDTENHDLHLSDDFRETCRHFAHLAIAAGARHGEDRRGWTLTIRMGDDDVLCQARLSDVARDRTPSLLLRSAPLLDAAAVRAQQRSRELRKDAEALRAAVRWKAERLSDTMAALKSELDRIGSRCPERVA
jgi:hypothetical protein